VISRRLRLALLLICAGALVFVLVRFDDVSSPRMRESATEREITPMVSPGPEENKQEGPSAPAELAREDEDDLDNDDEIESATPASAAGANPTSFAMTRPSAAPQGNSASNDEEVVSYQAFSADDARSIFSPLAQEGSRVTNDEFFSGVRVERPAAPEAAPTPEPTKEPEGGLPWVEGQARGYTMLYAMQPAARRVVERNVQALLTSHVKDVYIGVLIDGTFGQDFEYLRTLVTRLSSNGRRLTLALYLSNGPTMRKWDETPIDALFSRINPREFRNRIIREQALQSQYVEVARKAKRVFAFNTSLSPFNTNVAIPMLEDNLDRNSYRVMRDLARNEIRENCVFMRNPCVGCFLGNDGDTLGDPREEHTMQLFSSLKPGDSFSLDGIGFVYPGMGRTIELSADELLNVMSSSYEKGLRYVGLWRHDWQGVKHGVPNDHPESRAYLASGDDELGFEIDALRHRLSPVTPEEEDEEVYN
jgi:hypothetical protein